ncbi:MAG: hypothetical protein M1833_000175 [Piccolia ochrophora]|nr:MAG: hypothetical protein M1833_000175 [Piccolia ochrophora]
MSMIEITASNVRQMQDVADILAKSKKVIVVTGAGISTNSGIPDFRSENGLYSLIQARYDAASQSVSTLPTPESTRSSTPVACTNDNIISSQSSTTSTATARAKLPRLKGRDLFDAQIWNDSLSTSIFYTFIASLRKTIREEVRTTTPTHKFVRTLRDGGRLIRCYTQNIDGLESRDGLCTDLLRGKGNKARFMTKVVSKPRPEGPVLPGYELDGGCEVVQLHGDLDVLRCGLCASLSSWDEADRELAFLNGEAPECDACNSKNEDRQKRGKREISVGQLRPNVVLYGEEHPSAQLLSPITTHDLSLSPDVLLIMGTSLRVHGLKVLVREFAKAVHARKGGKGKVVFVNNTKPSESVWSDVIDYWINMDCDTWVNDLHERRADLWLRQGELKLPTKKTKTSTKADAKRLEEKPTTTSADDDKENIVPASTKPPKATTTRSKPTTQKKKSTAVKQLIIRSPAHKATRATKKPRRVAQPPLLPSKALFNPSLPPTPPSSQTTPTKRQSPTPESEDALLASPSKRRSKTSRIGCGGGDAVGVCIWVDDEAEMDLGGVHGGSEQLGSGCAGEEGQELVRQVEEYLFDR